VRSFRATTQSPSGRATSTREAISLLHTPPADSSTIRARYANPRATMTNASSRQLLADGFVRHSNVTEPADGVGSVGFHEVNTDDRVALVSSAAQTTSPPR
jgi:hypothetical protein